LIAAISVGIHAAETSSRAAIRPAPALQTAPVKEATGATPPGSSPDTVVSTGPSGPTGAWVIAENAKPGSPDWPISQPALSHKIEGYADQVSIDTGESFGLFVSTTAPTWQVRAYRIGYYKGVGGRLVWTSPVQPGSKQAACPVAPPTNTVECHWSQSLEIAADVTTWPPGDYLLKLVASTGYQSYVPLTIRDDDSDAAFVVNNSVTTYQAYNLYGGSSGRGAPTYADRARIVSFDRPYQLGHGMGDFGNEMNLVSLVESQGLDVTYVTDIDVAENPGLVLRHRAFISLGHDEYYSASMRAGLVNAVNQGVNLMFLGANAIYRHVRLSDSPLGPDRLETDYKDAQEDPLLGTDNADVIPVAWRDWPNNEPEESILGAMYQCNPVHADAMVADPSSWIFNGTGVSQGQHLTGVVGPEYDEYDPAYAGPQDVTGPAGRTHPSTSNAAQVGAGKDQYNNAVD
jgi:hypothetical protein